jgi:hypothetical protein
MIRVFLDDTQGYPDWLNNNPDGFVVTVDQRFAGEEFPRKDNGEIDFEAIPERLFGSEHIIRQPDGSVEYVGLPEWQTGSSSAVLHRATCGTIRTLGDRYSKHCAPREDLDELTGSFAGADLHRDESCGPPAW